MKTFALFGDPVSHSLSPVFQNAAFKAAGVEAEYIAERVPAAELPAAVKRVRSGELAGANVTIPHKLAVLALADFVTPEARLIGAANWLGLNKRGKLVADNTDARGLLRAVEEAKIKPAGGKAIVVGAGGAARAAVVALLRMEVGSVRVGARRSAEARRLVGELRAGFPEGNPGGDERFERLAALELSSLGDSSIFCDLLVSAVPPAAWPEVESVFDETGAPWLLDLAYAKGGTPAEKWARARGMQALGGLPMLLHQGALSFERWLGIDFPMDAARRALNAALG